MVRESNKKIMESTQEEKINLIKRLGTKGFKLVDSSRLHYIGGIHGMDGDFFLMFPTGEIRLILSWELFKQGKNRRVEVYRFMLIDVGLNRDITQWLNENQDFKLVDGFYEKLNCEDTNNEGSN